MGLVIVGCENDVFGFGFGYCFEDIGGVVDIDVVVLVMYLCIMCDYICICYSIFDGGGILDIGCNEIC